ncbi:MAG: acyl-CoA dehydrogenase family protein [Clostridia bacterium]|nr:acyl-CoA dehydrogenase family protein [Clostridia bacterium]
MANFKYDLFNKMIEEFALNEVKPYAAEVDEKEEFPYYTVEKMAKLGLMGIIVPKQYGGMGGDYKMYIKAVEELAKYCATTSVILSAHESLCVAPIMEYGTEEQKQKYLPKLASGEWLGAFGLTEPNAGTDANNQTTVAVPNENGDYVLNGSKIFITNAGPAHVYFITAVVGRNPKGVECASFIVESDMPGFSVGKKEKKMGIRGSSTCELIFQNCVVPAGNLVGKPGEGFKLAMKALDGGRIGIAAQALGIAEGALRETIAYTKERKQFKRSISAFQNTQFVLADLKTKIEAARGLVEKAVDAKQAKSRDISLYAAMAKLFCAETAMEVTTKAVQLHGGYGYTREYPVERMMRDAKITEIYEGTSEVQRMVISGVILK